MSGKREFTNEEARRIGDAIGVDWSRYPLEEFRDPQTNVTGDDEIATGKIALAHLKEIRDYYTRLLVMEKDAEAYWDAQGE
jgi:hypothetical protein